MTCRHRQVYRQIYRQIPEGTPVVLTRPEDRPRTVWLNADANDLAYASLAAGQAHFPVDAAIWLCCEAVSTIEPSDLDDVLASISLPDPERVPSAYWLWRAQLREGCGWHEPRLPQIMMPAALANTLTPAVTQAGVEFAADPERLRTVLHAEAAAVSDGGRRLSDLLAAASPSVRRSAAA